MGQDTVGARAAMLRATDQVIAGLSAYTISMRDLVYWRDGYGHEAVYRANDTAAVRFELLDSIIRILRELPDGN